MDERCATSGEGCGADIRVGNITSNFVQICVIAEVVEHLIHRDHLVTARQQSAHQRSPNKSACACDDDCHVAHLSAIWVTLWLCVFVRVEECFAQSHEATKEVARL
jgi:hypothetical protein